MARIQDKQKKGKWNKKCKRYGRRVLLVGIIAVLYIVGCRLRRERVYHDNNRNVFNNSAQDSVLNKDINIKSELKKLSKSDKRIANIANNIEDYSEDLLKLLIRNTETIEFVLGYPAERNSQKTIKLTKEERSSKVPLFLQWDKRWGYEQYGNNMIAITGCGPTCLSMVLVGLTGDTSANPKKIAEFSEQKGYATQNNGTDWRLFSEGATKLGLKVKEVPLWEAEMIKELEKGNSLICSMGPGDFTTTGHFIVLYGYQDGSFLVNDPNSKANSSQKWSYHQIQNQIKNIWSFSK